MVGRAVPEQTQVLKYDVAGGGGEPRFDISGESKFDIHIRAEPRCGRNLICDISGGQIWNCRRIQIWHWYQRFETWHRRRRIGVQEMRMRSLVERELLGEASLSFFSPVSGWCILKQINKQVNRQINKHPNKTKQKQTSSSLGEQAWIPLGCLPKIVLKQICKFAQSTLFCRVSEI